MGFVRVRVGVFNPAVPDKAMEIDGIVDTGAIYTVIRRDILEGLSIKPSGRRRFKAFGGYVERDIGEAGLMIMGERRIVPVIFGETEDTMVIGITALEIFGLEVDPVRGSLKEAELLLL
ncbi:aspartyl protease [Caldivirga sp.]|uniref:aspartyl protease n=1 Tax=Caldivirga sp. TaxID=2080243 RepID=UPI0025C4A9D5|nr:aspartyl protease [Caldivirga sp.]